MRNFSFFAIICLSLFAACSDDYMYVTDNGLDYLPVRAGKYSEFDVTRTVYAIGRPADKSGYIQRETAIDSFADPSGNTVYQLAYSVPDSINWKTDSIGIFWYNKDQVLAREGGNVIVKLMVPVYESRFWDGNQYNTTEKNYFELRNYKKSFSTPAGTFPETITIVRQYDSTLVSKKAYVEVYAKGVGLIKRERSFVQYCNTPDCAGKGVINSGWEEVSILKAYEQ